MNDIEKRGKEDEVSDFQSNEEMTAHIQSVFQSSPDQIASLMEEWLLEGEVEEEGEEVVTEEEVVS